jgi:hypothetical protein
MLDAHPLLAVPPEAYFTLRVLRRHPAGVGGRFHAEALVAELSADGSFRNWELPLDALATRVDEARPADAPGLLRCVYAEYAAQRGKPRAADKTPRNVLHIERLAAAFPEARFVHLVRDGRDVVPSVLEHLLGPDHFTAGVDYWQERVQAGRRAGAALGPARYVEVRYEDLVARPAETLARLGPFIGVADTTPMLGYQQHATAVLATVWDSRRHERIAAPPAGVRDWRVSLEPHRVQLFEALAGSTLEDFGYERAFARPSVAARAQARAWRLARPLRRVARPLTDRMERRRRDRRRQVEGAPPRRRARKASESANNAPRSSS